MSIDSRELVELVAEVGSLNFVGAELERFVVGDPRQVDVAQSSSEFGANSGDSVIAGKSFVESGEEIEAGPGALVLGDCDCAIESYDR